MEVWPLGLSGLAFSAFGFGTSVQLAEMDLGLLILGLKVVKGFRV